MGIRQQTRSGFAYEHLCVLTMTLLTCLLPAGAQTDPKNPETVTLDRVVALVNRQAILLSDLEDEMQLSVLDPSTKEGDVPTEQQSLERLISRALIQQQIQQENIPSADPTAEDVTARLTEIRSELPACVRANCRSDAGWKAFLSEHGLSAARVDRYIRNRLEVLAFIELRFRQGIRISPEEIDSYYRETLLPQYPAGQSAPPLAQVSARIEEILLQERVNVLFDNWLANLRKQGQIEVLDPALEPTAGRPSEGANKE